MVLGSFSCRLQEITLKSFSVGLAHCPRQKRTIQHLSWSWQPLYGPFINVASFSKASNTSRLSLTTDLSWAFLLRTCHKSTTLGSPGYVRRSWINHSVSNGWQERKTSSLTRYLEHQAAHQAKTQRPSDHASRRLNQRSVKSLITAVQTLITAKLLKHFAKAVASPISPNITRRDAWNKCGPVSLSRTTALSLWMVISFTCHPEPDAKRWHNFMKATVDTRRC